MKLMTVYLSQNSEKFVRAKITKLCLSKKANVYNDERCSWREVCATVDEKPPIGSRQLKLTEAPLSFYKIGRLLYERGIFTDPEGRAVLDRVAELHSNSPGSKDGKNKQLIEDVIKTSEDIVNNSTKIDVTQSLNVLTRQVHNTITCPIPETVINIHNDQVFDVPDNDDE